MVLRRWLPFVLVAAVVLAACRSNTPPQMLPATPTATVTPRATVAVATAPPLPTPTPPPDPCQPPAGPDGEPLHASRPLTVELVSQLGGALASPGNAANVVAAQGQYVYVGIGPRLLVLDAADPARPVIVGQTDVLPGLLQGVAIAGDTAFGVDGDTLYAIDVTDPRQPVLVGSRDVNASSLAAQGDRAYVSGNGGMQVIDASDPTQLRTLGRLGSDRYTGKIAVQGDRAYLLDIGLRIVDVSDPANPVQLGSFQERPYGVYSLAVSDQPPAVAYLGTEYGLQLVDISDPAQPRELSFVLEGMWIQSIAPAGDRLVVTGDDGLFVLDVSDPAAPQIVGQIDLPLWASGGMALPPAQQDTGRAFLYLAGLDAEGGDSLRIVDITDPTAPSAVDFLSTVSEVLDVLPAQGIVYLAAGNAGLAAVDVSDPAAPRLISSQPTGIHSEKLAGAGDIVAVVGMGQENGTLQLFDVSDPASLKRVGQTDSQDVRSGVALVGTPDSDAAPAYAYTCSQDGGFSILDISDSSQPKVVGSLAGSCSQGDIWMDGDPTTRAGPAYALIGSGGADTLTIVEVSNPNMPERVSELYLNPGLADTFAPPASFSRILYLGAGHGLMIVDAANLAEPHVVSFYDTMWHAYDAEIVPDPVASLPITRPNYALLAADEIQLVDVSNPCEPVGAGVLAAPGGATRIAIEDNLAYVAAGGNGLLVLRLLQDKVAWQAPAEGGMFSSSDGDTHIAFVPGAFDQPAAITYRRLWTDQQLGDAQAGSPLAGIAHTFELHVAGAADGQPLALAGSQPFTVTVHYDDADARAVREETMGLYAWDGAQWIRDPSSRLDLAGNVLTASPTASAQRWAVLGEARPDATPVAAQAGDEPLLPVPRVTLEQIAATSGFVHSLAQQGRYAYLGVDKRVWVFDVADPRHPQPVGVSDPFPGHVIDLAISGDTLFLADEVDVRVLDVSTPQTPRELATLDTPGYRNSLAVSGDILYVGETYGYVGEANSEFQAGTLRIFDVSDPRHPIELSGDDDWEIVEDIVVQGDYGYAVDRRSGLVVLDLENPAAPVRVGALASPANKLAVSGDLIAAINQGGLQVIDVSNPAAPRNLGFYDIGYRVPADVAIDGQLAYLLDSPSDTEDLPPGSVIRVLDLSDPAQPTQIAAYSTAYRYASFLQLADGGTPGVLYLASDDGLETLQLSTGENPTRLGRTDLPSDAQDVVIDGDVAYMALESDGLLTVDVRDPNKTVALGMFQAEEPGRVTAMALSRQGTGAATRAYAYLSIAQRWDRESNTMVGEPGLRVVDVTDPATPEGVGFLPLELDAGGQMLQLKTDVEISGTVAFVPGWESGLQIVDVATPAQPALLASYQTAGSVQGVVEDGGMLYLAERSRWDEARQQSLGGGLRVLDMSDPGRPREIAYDPSVRNALDVVVADHIAYVTAFDGVHILDISDPEQPVTLGHFDTTGSDGRIGPLFQKAQLVGQRLYLAAGHAPVTVLDVSRPSHPTLVGSAFPSLGGEWGGPSQTNSLAVAGDYLFTANNPGGLVVFRIEEQ